MRIQLKIIYTYRKRNKTNKIENILFIHLISQCDIENRYDFIEAILKCHLSDKINT